MRRLINGVLLFGLAVAPGFASAGSFQGTFATDNQVALYNITVNASETITIQSYSYGGRTVNSTTVPPGGFAPTAYLFDNTGGVLTLFSGTCSQVAQDPTTSNCDDLYFQVSLAPGVYTLALAVYDNTPVDTSVADGFVHDGDPGFTCLEADVSGSFCDLTTALGVSRTGYYAIAITGADSVSPASPGPPGPVPVTFQTSPPGLNVTIDSVTSASPVTVDWLLGTMHTIAVASPQAAGPGMQYVFANWSDSGAASHSIIGPSSPTTYTAAFTTQYLLTTSATNGTISPPTGFFNAGSTVSISTSANTNFHFSSFVGPVTETSPGAGTVLMNQPQTVTAVFAPDSNGTTPSNGTVAPSVLNLVDYIGGNGRSVLSGAFTVSTSDGQGFLVSGSAPWLNVSVNGNTVNISVNTQAVTGSFFATVNLTFTFHDGTTQIAPVTLQAIGLPQFVLPGGTTALTFSVAAGSAAPPPQTIAVSSSGANIPAQATATSSGWLSVTGGGATPQMFAVQVNPTGLAVGTYHGSITITSTFVGINPLTVVVTLTVTPSTAITVSAFDNAGSLQNTPAAPDTIFTAFGTFPNCTAGAQVTADGNPTAVFYSSPTQINFLIPATVSGNASTSLAITCAGLSSGPLTVPVAVVAPSLFTVAQTGSGQADSVNQDNSIDTAVPPGTVVQLYGTGFGLYAPVGANGLTNLAQTVTAAVGGIPAQVLFAGQAPGYTPGLQQIDILIPANAPAGSNIPLALIIDGVTTQVGLTLTVQ
jgi:uncharacterized protein (TIGR03437 family)